MYHSQVNIQKADGSRFRPRHSIDEVDSLVYDKNVTKVKYKGVSQLPTTNYQTKKVSEKED